MIDDGDDAGAFGPRFIMPCALRITGPLDTTALQDALDDLVVRHEILRTIVIRDATPPYQRVRPPSPVPLHIHDLREAVRSRPRDEVAEEAVIEAKRSCFIDARQVPLLRAVLIRLDDRDWVLNLLFHHSASDSWSGQVALRDLAAYYAARTTKRPASLPPVRQYREFAEWQQARLADPAVADMLSYWQDKLAGARIFALPADRPVADRHSQPCSAHNFTIPATIMTAAVDLAKASRGSAFMVLIAAFNVLAHNITGTTDPVIDTQTTGRTETSFRDTVGTLLNFLPLRTGLADCVTFHDVLLRTTQTCLDGFAHEIPIQHIEQALPDLMKPNEDPANCNFIVGVFSRPIASEQLMIGGRSHEIGKLTMSELVSSDIPHGLAWTLNLLHTGEAAGSVQYNRDEWDEGTIIGLVSGYCRILAAAVSEPHRAWRTL